MSQLLLTLLSNLANNYSNTDSCDISHRIDISKTNKIKVIYSLSAYNISS